MKLKALERAWKALFFGIITRGRRGSATDLIPAEVPLRILVLRQDRIGDAVITTGLLRVLKASRPGNVVDVLASPANAPVLRRDPHVGSVHIYNKRRRATFPALYRALRTAGYDVVIDCMITAPSMTSLLLMMATGARHRIGLAGRGVDTALTSPVPAATGRTHIIDLMAPLALPVEARALEIDMSPRLEVQHHERERADAEWARIADPSATRLLVNVSAGKAEREWPRERFVAVIERVASRFPTVSVGVVGSPTDRERTLAIARASGATMLETPTIPDLISLIATADCLLTPDTSVTHMASALKIPAVVLFQHQAIADQWGLYGSPGTCVIGGVDSLIDLPVARVLPEVLSLVGERLGRGENRAGQRVAGG